MASQPSQAPTTAPSTHVMAQVPTQTVTVRAVQSTQPPSYHQAMRPLQQQPSLAMSHQAIRPLQQQPSVTVPHQAVHQSPLHPQPNIPPLRGVGVSQIHIPPLLQEQYEPYPVVQRSFSTPQVPQAPRQELPPISTLPVPFARPRTTSHSPTANSGNAISTSSPVVSPLKTISSPLLANEPVEPVQTSPMAAQYWNRLHSLLTTAKSTLSILHPTSAALAQKEDKGTSGVVAMDLQGRTLSTVKEVRSKASVEWETAFSAGGIGNFVSYGVHHTSAAWVALRLSQVVSGCATPKVLQEVLNENDDASDELVEDVRVRVWESEVALLPVSFVESVLAARRRMRKIKNRIELCVKILAALEGRGRRLTDASLDKAKLALEKADLAAKAEEDRLEAARRTKAEKERKAAERAGKKNGKLQKDLERKRKRRQASAAANFMMRFVKQKAEQSSSGTGDKTKDHDEVVDVEMEDDRRRALPLPLNRDVVSVSWWLISEMEERPVTELDTHLSSHQKDGAGETTVSVSMRETREHLQVCAKRRKEAESSVNGVLEKYRNRRKTLTDHRNPFFARNRAEVRGRAEVGPVKLLQFEEDYRPAFYGTCRRRARVAGPRRPFKKESDIDYSCDSGEEWEDDDGEDILDVEADKERDNEDAELKQLYGSDDEEDDDDFLDDGDLDDDDDDDERDDMDISANPGNKISEEQEKLSQTAAPAETNPSSKSVTETGVVDLTGPDAATVPKETSGSSPKRKLLREDQKDLRKRQRRNKKLRQSIVIQGVSIPDTSEPSPLDRYAVTALDGAPTILMFNPYITHVSAFLQETSPPKPAPAKISRTTLDDAAKLDLAHVMVHTNSRTSRDSIVYEFCERRRSLGLPIPPKVEVVRAIRIIGTNEKRKGDSRPAWYLRDKELAAKLSTAKISAAKPPPVSTPVSYDGVSVTESPQRGQVCRDPYHIPEQEALAQ